MSRAISLLSLHAFKERKEKKINFTPTNFMLLGQNVFLTAPFSQSLTFLCSQNLQAYSEELFI